MKFPEIKYQVYTNVSSAPNRMIHLSHSYSNLIHTSPISYLTSLIIIVASLIFIQNACYAQKQLNDSIKHQPEIPKLSPQQELQNDIRAIVDNPDFSNAFIGICVQSLENGDYLYRRNDTKNFIPASLQKILTTSAALEYLGKDFRYKTKLYLDGNLSSNGEFKGNLIIKGAGDPTFNEYFYENPAEIIEEFISKLDSTGIRAIRGNIIGDDYYFDEQYYAPGWAWDDFIYSYSPQVNSISIYDNKIDLTIIPADSIGKPARILIYPDNSYIQVINNIKTVSIAQTTQIEPVREQNTNIIELKGNIPIDTSKQKENLKISVTIDNPTLFFLNLFKDALNRHQLRFRGALFDISDWNETIDYSSLNPLFIHESHPLSDIIYLTNKVSHNLSADMLLKNIAKITTGTGSFAKGIEQVKKFISTKGINPENISIVDGSGLSRYNLISPNYIVTLLSAMHHSEMRAIFLNSFAVPGGLGTLGNRLTGSLAEKSVKAKTGTMNNVSNICGYITTRDREALAFCIMLNNFTVPQSLARNLQDLICMRLASFSRKR